MNTLRIIALSLFAVSCFLRRNNSVTESYKMGGTIFKGTRYEQEIYLDGIKALRVVRLQQFIASFYHWAIWASFLGLVGSS